MLINATRLMLIMLSFLEEAGISNMTSTDSSIWGLGAFVCICVGWWSIVCVSACVFLFVCVCEYLRVWKRENWNWKELWAIYGTSEVLGMPFILRQMVLRYMFSCLVALTLLEVLYLPFTLWPHIYSEITSKTLQLLESVSKNWVGKIRKQWRRMDDGH